MEMALKGYGQLDSAEQTMGRTSVAVRYNNPESAPGRNGKLSENGGNIGQGRFVRTWLSDLTRYSWKISPWVKIKNFLHETGRVVRLTTSKRGRRVDQIKPGLKCE